MVKSQERSSGCAVRGEERAQAGEGKFLPEPYSSWGGHYHSSYLEPLVSLKGKNLQHCRGF
jgi:hypothetical protein